jgi:transcription elongation factor GreA
MKITEKELITPEGKAKLEAELQKLQTTRPEALKELQEARAMGDLRENSAYQAAKDRVRTMDRRIRYLESTLRKSHVVKKTNTSTVELGSLVEMQVNGNKVTYTLVGKAEADPKQKKISLESPLGKLLHHKKVGQTVELNINSHTTQYKILKVS